MRTKGRLAFSVDVLIHVLILFTFLTIFFFSYVSKLERQNLSHVTASAVQGSTKKVLNLLDKNAKVPVNWSKLDSASKNLVASSATEDPEIERNNREVLRNSVVAICCVFLVITTLILIGKFVFHLDMDLKHILVTNVVVFAFTGVLEFLFFQFVASKYVPVTPDSALGESLDEVEKDVGPQ